MVYEPDKGDPRVRNNKQEENEIARLSSKFSQGHTVTLHLPKWRNVILVSSVPRKHDSNRPYALLRFWKSQIVIEII